jgi:rod shape-determining protein MreD
MKTFWTLLAIVAAAVLQTALSRIFPHSSQLFDPFLLVVVYCGLTYGETHGMLAGTVAGWVQDVQFGGQIAGLSGLTKLILGFLVGLAGTRFLLVGAAPQILVISAATIADALLMHSLASVFSIQTLDLSATGLAIRAVVNALVGAGIFTMIDRRVGRESFS